MPQAGKQLRFFQMTYDTARDIGFLYPHLRRCQDKYSVGSLAVLAVRD